jgi:hypothetical protein
MRVYADASSLHHPSYTPCNDLHSAARTAMKMAQMSNRKQIVSLQRLKCLSARMAAGQSVGNHPGRIIAARFCPRAKMFLAIFSMATPNFGKT